MWLPNIKESALPAATGKSANEKSLWLHITTSRTVCQTLRGIVAWAALLGLLGIVGGMDQETIRIWPGMVWAAAMLVIFAWASKPWQS